MRLSGLLSELLEEVPVARSDVCALDRGGSSKR